MGHIMQDAFHHLFVNLFLVQLQQKSHMAMVAQRL